MTETKTSNLNFKSKDFVHLHVHTDFSLLQSTVQLKPLAKRLDEHDMKACAMTDYGNMFGAISFYNTMKAEGIHPIIGYEAYLTSGSRFDKEITLDAGEKPYYQIVLLAKNLAGYYNLTHLASMAYTDGFHHKPRIDFKLLEEKSEGLVCLSSGTSGAVWHYLRQGNIAAAEKYANQLQEIFGKENFYVEIQNQEIQGQTDFIKEVAGFARKNNFSMVAANDVHYLNREDAKAHEILLAIGESKNVNDNTRTIFPSRNFHLRTAEEMWDLFGEDYPDALENSLKIAEMCRVEIVQTDNLALPLYPIPADSGCQTIDEYFEKVVWEGFNEKREKIWDPLAEKGELRYSLDEYRQRIEIETGIIKDMGFPGYFLIVWDFILYARRKDIPVGPGRGSAAGSLIAYCLGITDIDPIQYDLLFERFLNPERVSMPDIDIDFCVRGRAEVINHVSEFYGRESVCQIITFGTMASKAAIKDVGRALAVPLGDVEKIAKLIPPPVRGRNTTISQAIEQVEDLQKAMQTNPKTKEIVELALKLEGCSRHTSVHAAGVVISPKPLHELVPIALSTKNELTSQYTMNDLEKVGMLKMDFLALTTLTIISDCLKSLKRSTGVEINWNAVDLCDEKSMELFADGRTDAIFQFESSGMQEICRRLKPKNLEDLAALNALYRPGPLDGGMVDDFIDRHRGEKSVRYIIPQMKEILDNTYGVLVYQEQIMQLAQKLAGYSLGEADMMRRAMGKKKRSEMAVHTEKFINGAVERKIDREKAEQIFNLMAQFADYGFNRSHSVAYAYLAFQTAYLKAHYPAYFYAAVLSGESQDTTKIYKYSNELRLSGLELLPPDINESETDFTPSENAVRFGLGAIKGIGTTSVEAIIRAREEAGRFSSLYDFTSKMEQGAVNRRGLESLVCAGAFDSIKPDDIIVNSWRAKLYDSVGGALSHGQKLWNDRNSGQTALFGMSETSVTDFAGQYSDVKEWTRKELSEQEKNSIGFYLSTHPLDEFKTILIDLHIRNVADYTDIQPGEYITLAGIVTSFQVRHSKKGNRFCIFRLEDQSSGVKCLGWSEMYSKYAAVLQNDQLIIVNGKVESNEGQEITLIVDEVQSLSDAVPLKARRVSIDLSGEEFDNKYLEDIFQLLSRRQGVCEVVLNLNLEEKVSLQIHAVPMRIQGTGELERELKDRKCGVKWHL